MSTENTIVKARIAEGLKTAANKKTTENSVLMIAVHTIHLGGGIRARPGQYFWAKKEDAPGLLESFAAQAEEEVPAFRYDPDAEAVVRLGANPPTMPTELAIARGELVQSDPNLVAPKNSKNVMIHAPEPDLGL